MTARTQYLGGKTDESRYRLPRFIRVFFVLMLLVFLPFTAQATEPPIVALGLTPSATELLAVSNNQVELRQTADLTKRRIVECPLDQVRAFAFSASGDRLALAGGIPGEEGAVALLAWPSGKLLAKREISEDWFTTIAWSNDDAQLLVGGHDGDCRIIGGRDLKNVHTWSAHEKGVTDVQFLPGGKLAATTGVDGVLRVWTVATAKEVRGLNNHAGMIHAIALRDGEGLPVVCTVGRDRTVRFWQPTIGRMVRFVKLPWQPLAVIWQNEDTVAVTGEKGQLAIIQYATATIVSERSLLQGWGYAIAKGEGTVWLGGENGEINKLIP